MNRPLEKVVWLFTRKEGTSRTDFFHHYLTVHAPLAVRHHRALRGYSLNLSDVLDDVASRTVAGIEVDAVTVNWREPGRQIFDSETDRDELIADHASFLGERHAFTVLRERIVVPRADEPTVGRPSTGAKLVLFATEHAGFGLVPSTPELMAASPPFASPGDEVLEWVENAELASQDTPPSEIVGFHEIRVRSLAQARAVATRAKELGWVPVHVTEHVQIARPTW